MWRCCCVYCTMGGDPSGKQHVSDAINDLTVLHHGVTQPILHPCIGVALVMHGVADVCCLIQTGHGLPLMEGRAGDEIGASGHDVVCVVHATIISTGSDGLLASVCHLANWLRQPTSLCYLVLQQLWIVFLCFCDQFIYTVLVVIVVHVIIQYRHHCLDVHVIQDLID